MYSFIQKLKLIFKCLANDNCCCKNNIPSRSEVVGYIYKYAIILSFIVAVYLVVDMILVAFI